MQIHILLFASLRDRAGRKELELELPEAATVRLAAETLQHEIANLDLRGSMCAVNERYANPSTALSDGDTIAFLPPVSGG